MSKAPTAKLLNAPGCVTLHQCIRLVVQPATRKTDTFVGQNEGTYPVYECLQSGAERIYGFMRLKTPREDLQLLFPGVPVVTEVKALDLAA